MFAAEPVLALSPGPQRPGLLAFSQCLSLGKLDRPAVALPKVVAASLAGQHLEAPLVQQPVVVRAQQHEVLQARLPAVRPVPDMMRVQPPRVRAPRKAAGPVASGERPAHRRRHSSGLPSDRQGFPVPVLDDPHRGAVAQQPLHGLDRQVRGASLAAQRGFIHVHHHQVAACG